MADFLRRSIAHPGLALLSTVLWGLVELIALQGARRVTRVKSK